MELTNKYDKTVYEEILKKHQGLFNIKLKIPVRDSHTLSLVYTPGVAASCKAIQKNLNDSLKYTNKFNSVLVVTDSSGFNKKEGWCNWSIIPYLEAICVYYKRAANIDAYPIVLDHNLVKNGEDLYETVNALMPAFSAVEFFNVSDERYQTFVKLAGENPGYAYTNSSKKSELDKNLNNISSNQIYSAILRAALDCQFYTELSDVLETVLVFVCHSTFGQRFYNNFNFIFNEALDKILGSKFLQNVPEKEINLNHGEFNKEYVLNKTRLYQLEGSSAWVDVYPKNYHSALKTNDQNSLLLHYRYRGMVETGSKLNFVDVDTLNKLLTWENIDHIHNMIFKNHDLAFTLTCKSNFGAIITNGTAILGLGNIGALAGLPVMEGKSAIFKLYGGSDIMPLCIQELNADKFIKIVQRLGPSFSIINLEDIKAPECFKIESTLNSLLDYSVFHDDQHGTAVVVLAGLINSLKLRGGNFDNVKVIMNGAGAAGLSVTQLLVNYGLKNFIICDTEGAIYEGREKNMNDFKNNLAKLSNRGFEKGSLKEVIKGADVFIGLSAAGALTKEMVQSMNKDPIIFALANPTPEIFPEEALEAGAFIVATGRSDFPNQINNSLAFPGIFRAGIDIRAKEISIEMKIAAATAIANLVKPDMLRREYVIPGSLDTSVSIKVTQAVAEVAFKHDHHRNKKVTSDLIFENIESWFREGDLINFDYIENFGNEFNI